MTLFFDARNVLDSKNIQNLSPNDVPEPVREPDRATTTSIYYTETGRAGGAYLQDINGDSIPDWVPVNDPRVFDEGRNVRVGVSVTF